jgi:hypothetical protein
MTRDVSAMMVLMPSLLWPVKRRAATIVKIFPVQAQKAGKDGLPQRSQK